MGRSISAGVLARDQIDIYNPANSFTRATGILPAGVTLKLFFNNTLVSWSIIDGTSVIDSSIGAGSVYFNEVSGSPGYYNIRFFPDRVGFWRFIFSITVNSTEVIKEYDVVPSSQGNVTGGLNASFVRP